MTDIANGNQRTKMNNQQEMIETAQALNEIRELVTWCDTILVKLDDGTFDLITSHQATSRDEWWDEAYGPFPSNSMFDHKNSVDFLERAGVIRSGPNKDRIGLNKLAKSHWLLILDWPDFPTQLDLAKAILNLAQRAYRLGDYTDTTEEEAKPFLIAVNLGIQKD